MYSIGICLAGIILFVIATTSFIGMFMYQNSKEFVIIFGILSAVFGTMEIAMVGEGFYGPDVYGPNGPNDAYEELPSTQTSKSNAEKTPEIIEISGL